MRRKTLLTLGAATTAAILVLSSCGKNDTSDESNAKDSSTYAEDTTEEVKTSAEAVNLSSDELDEFTDLFDTSEYNGFLVTPYNSVTEIAWDDVLYNGAGIAKTDIAKSEKNAYLKAVGDSELYTDLTAIEATAIDEYMQSHAGVSFDDIKDTFKWTYLEKYDSYYFQHGDTNYQPFTCVYGKKLDDTYVLTIESDLNEVDAYMYYPDRELTVKSTDDGYMMVSNVYQWEKGNDEQQTFDIDLSWEDKTCRFITYQGSEANDQTAHMIITCDGKIVDWLSTTIYPSYSEEYIDIITVAAVGAFDFNADGLTDIVVVADCNDGQRHMALYETSAGYYNDDGYYLTLLSDTSDWLEGFVSGELNLPNIKAYLLGDNTSGSYDTWKDAYGQLIKIDNSEYYSMFSLAYLDNDEIPELVLDQVGYRLRVYTFKDGHAQQIGYDLSYGTGGNGGYEYASKKNCIRYYSTDYAGVIGYTNYLSKDNDDKLVTDYSITVNNYDDLNGNGLPDDDEMTDKALENAKGSIEYEANDKNLSSKEIKARIDEIENNYSFEGLCGIYEYVEFLDYLEQF